MEIFVKMLLEMDAVSAAKVVKEGKRQLETGEVPNASTGLMRALVKSQRGEL